jgi:acyl-CoA synthetase (AMP-forming)/AMP-acid ligase II
MFSTRSILQLKNNRLLSLKINSKLLFSSSSAPIFLKDKYSNFSLQQLNGLSKTLSQSLLKNLNVTDLKGQRIAVLCSNNYTYMLSLMAIWQANGVPLGLNKQYPSNLIEYFLDDSKCKLVINGIGPNEQQNDSDRLNMLLDKQKVLNYKIVENEFFKTAEESPIAENSLDFFRGLLNKDLNKEALILYTSGTRYV